MPKTLKVYRRGRLTYYCRTKIGGAFHGPCVVFSRGKLLLRGKNTNNVPSGTWSTYNAEGRVKATIDVERGKFNGFVVYYADNGCPIAFGEAYNNRFLQACLIL